MYLVAVDDADRAGAGRLEVGRPQSDRWEDFPVSSLADHGGACCAVAREWIAAMDFAQLNGGDVLTGPRWLRQKYEWGPSPWPMHWCELVARKTIDCGAHSALADLAFAARGVTAFRAQFVQRYSAGCAAQWRKKWSDEQVSDHWIADDVIYHEGNALLVGAGKVKLWDASAGWWLNPIQQGGYGSLVAVRISAPARSGDCDGFEWGSHRLTPGVWTQIAG